MSQDARAKRALRFRIKVTDEGTTRGLPVFERRSFRNWRHIGDIVIHYNHPTWRENHNHPSTATRVAERKVH